ncbi:MAG: hypothetical protein HRF43_02190 [Phycisphaerae bacterium]|jgi:hypothetical protein
MKTRSLTVVPFLFLSAGCIFNPVPNLPEELEVVLPAGQKAAALVNSGPELLDGSVWSLFRKPDAEGATPPDGTAPGPYGGLLTGGFLERPAPDALMGLVHFGPGGRVTRISENAFYLPEIFGTDIVVDGRFHGTRVPGLRLAAASFGVSDGDRIGVALPVDVRFLGVPVGTAVVYHWGTRTGDRIDGTFGYQADFTGGLGGLILGAGGGDQYLVYALEE